MPYPFLAHAQLLDEGTLQELDTLVTRLRAFLSVSLQEDGTLYPLTGLLPAAHHTTHEAGGSDVILFPSGLLERGRTVPLGEWINIAYSAGNFGASGSMTWTVTAGSQASYKYTLIGRTAIVSFLLNATTIGGTPDSFLRLTMPVTAAEYANNMVLTFTTVNGTGSVQATPGSNVLALSVGITGAWPTGTAYIYGQIAVPI